MKRFVTAGVIVVGVAVGLWHFRLAVEAMFVFRTGEPITSWIAMLCGPITTLPAVLASVFWRKAAGYWLIAMAICSTVAFFLGEKGLTDNIIPFFWTITAPMIGIGGALQLSRRH